MSGRRFEGVSLSQIFRWPAPGGAMLVTRAIRVHAKDADHRELVPQVSPSTPTRLKQAPARALVLIVIAGLMAAFALGLAGRAWIARTAGPSVGQAVVDSVESDTGLVCLRQSEGNLVDCYPSSVHGLAAGETIDYALTSALIDPRRAESGSQQVITWAVAIAG